MTLFIDDYDCALFDLDGVIYLGPDVVPGIPEAVTELRRRGVKLGFVTNNAGRSARVVVKHLNDLGIVCESDDVVTSAQAIARLMARELPAGAKVQVCGSQALADEIADVGFQVVHDYRDNPAAVVQGYDPNLSWPSVDNAGLAIQAGARWFASNTDMYRPTEQGFVPGVGAQIAALRTVAPDIEITIAGKPCPPLLQETIAKKDTLHPVFVGDRLDTDIEGAYNVGIDSFMVFTGAHGKYDLAVAPVKLRPSAIGWNIGDMLKPRRVASIDEGRCRCGSAEATVTGSLVALAGPLSTVDEQLDALWSVLQLVWSDDHLDCTSALESLDQLP